MSKSKTHDPKMSHRKFPKFPFAVVLAGVLLTIFSLLQHRDKALRFEGSKSKPETIDTAIEARGANRPILKRVEPIAVEETPTEPRSNAVEDYLVENFLDQGKDWSRYKLANVKISEKGILWRMEPSPEFWSRLRWS
jgi:hypothetical protein